MNTNVMFTDIVGYSKLTGDDQNLALELLKKHDKIIEPIIKQYHGSIVKRIGDAIVAIFDDTTNIIQAAIEIQQALKNRNNRNTKSRHIILRIGLHYGEIVLKNDEVYGLGYELASSIEPICEYGGVAISQDLYDNAHEDDELILRGKKNHFFIRPIAQFSFKSISNKLTIYKLYLNLLDWYDESQDKVHTYLAKQNIKPDIYDLNLLNSQSRSTIDHYQEAVNFKNLHNLSHSIYHYKMHLDYDINNSHDKYDIELAILHIFSTIGLNRLVDRLCDNLKKSPHFNRTTYLSFIKGVNSFNLKEFTNAQKSFEESTPDKNYDFLFEACYYLLFIYFNNKQFTKGLDLILYHEKDFKSDSTHKIQFNLIKSIFEYQKNKTDELEKKILNEHKNLSQNITDGKFSLFLYWFLIQFYHYKSDAQKSLETQDKARLSINNLANQISGLQLKELFIEKPILHQMLNEEIELNFISEDTDEDFIEKELSLNSGNDFFNFCIECGFKNDKNFPFCPSCGQKLKK
tara:strand:+ start:2099 stop:3649 length:1551 start_codon:yes stop_codon:yes gene_type:complete